MSYELREKDWQQVERDIKKSLPDESLGDYVRRVRRETSILHQIFQRAIVPLPNDPLPNE